MKALITMLLALAITTSAYAKDTYVYCPAIYHHAKHGAVDVTSNHGVSIRNTTGLAQTYHVSFDNAVYYSKSRQLPLNYSNSDIMVSNAHVEFDIKLLAGKEFHYGPMPISKKAYFEKAGHYKLQANTIIKLNEIVIDACTDYNVADIY